MTRPINVALVMTHPMKIAFIVIAVVLSGWIGYARVLKPMYLQPRAEYMANIGKQTTKLAEYRRNQQDHPRVDAAIKSIVDRTLGSDLETVDHRLRTRLNRLAEQVQLRSAAVGTTGQVKSRETPAKSRFPNHRALREELDFSELEAWISGSGTFEQVLALMHAIESEPWLKRIDQVKFDPRENGARFNVTVRLTTLFLPGRQPNPDDLPAGTPPNPERYAKLAAANPFRVPPPQAAPPSTHVATAPPQFPYDQWAVTGIAQSPAGIELWLLNRSTQESRRLTVGERLQDVEFVAANGETAEFRAGDQRFSVMVGGNLNDRTPVQ